MSCRCILDFPIQFDKIRRKPMGEGKEKAAFICVKEIDEDKLIDDVPVWTAEDFLIYAKECQICLFT
jgi:hypothetical protein